MEKYELEQLRRLLEQFFQLCEDDDEISCIGDAIIIVIRTINLFNKKGEK